MTKKEARRLVSRAIADSIEADIANGSEFLFTDGSGEPLSEADSVRVNSAAQDLADFLRRRVEPRAK